MTDSLFHWAPTSRRKQIIRYGLRPAMRPTTSSLKQSYICLSPDPRVAWRLSGEMGWNIHITSWDLWQTVLRADDQLADWQPPLEVRVVSRIYKSRLWYVATRAS